MTNRQVLLLILAFVVVTFGSFVWYVATWQSHTATHSSLMSHAQTIKGIAV